MRARTYLGSELVYWRSWARALSAGLEMWPCGCGDGGCEIIAHVPRRELA